MVSIRIVLFIMTALTDDDRRITDLWIELTNHNKFHFCLLFHHLAVQIWSVTIFLWWS